MLRLSERRDPSGRTARPNPGRGSSFGVPGAVNRVLDFFLPRDKRVLRAVSACVCESSTHYRPMPCCERGRTGGSLPLSPAASFSEPFEALVRESGGYLTFFFCRFRLSIIAPNTRICQGWRGTCSCRSCSTSWWCLRTRVSCLRGFLNMHSVTNQCFWDMHTLPHFWPSNRSSPQPILVLNGCGGLSWLSERRPQLCC